MEQKAEQRRGTLVYPRKVWAPQPGSQLLFLTCPVREVLYHGTRGPGKTIALLMDWLQFVGKGYGHHWRGILFRESFPQLADVVAKSKELFYSVFGSRRLRFNAGAYKWEAITGETLFFRYIKNVDDYWKYHGHEYPWIGWEELCNWPNLECYDRMKTCNRSAFPGIPLRIRATANPYGLGHHHVKRRFIDAGPPLKVIRDKFGERVHIQGFYWENKKLLEADPTYVETLEAITDENLKRAWLYGDWDIVAGGALSDIWDRSTHVIEPFHIPSNWPIDRGFDWGSSKPYAVLYFAEANGETVQTTSGPRTFYPGSIIVIDEIYGWNGHPNEGVGHTSSEIAQRVYSRDFEIFEKYGIYPKPGPADNAIFDVIDGESIADRMLAIDYNGKKVPIRWTTSNKGPGSRVAGLQRVRQMLAAAKKVPPEEPGLFIFNTCTQTIRTLPTLPRDPKRLDDVDTNAEDHIYDVIRYRVNVKQRRVKQARLSGT